MIEIIPFDKINKGKWDDCVRTSLRSNIFGYYDSVSAACDNWLGVVANDYEAVLALPIKKKFGFSYSWHPQFMGPLGIFARTEEALLFSDMLNLLPNYSWWIKMHYWQNQSTKEMNTQHRIFQELDLSSHSIELVRSGYNENTKRNIKKATKKNLKLVSLMDVDLLIDTFRKNKGDQIDNIDEGSYVLLRKLLVHWQSAGNAHITGVYDEENLAAIGGFLVSGTTIIYYKGAITDYGRAIGAMHYLIDSELEKHINICNTFDFGGSNLANVSQFYRGFGGVDVDYYLYNYKKFKI